MATWTGEGDYPDQDNMAQDDHFHKTVQVEGITNEMTHDTLWLLFESNKRSGGGEVTGVSIVYPWHMAWVTFKDASVAAAVRRRRQIEHKDNLMVSPLSTLVIYCKQAASRLGQIKNYFLKKVEKHDTGILDLYADDGGAVYIQCGNPSVANSILHDIHVIGDEEITVMPPNMTNYAMPQSLGDSNHKEDEQDDIIDDRPSENKIQSTENSLEASKSQWPATNQDHYHASNNKNTVFDGEEFPSSGDSIRHSSQDQMVSPGVLPDTEPFTDAVVILDSRCLPARTKELDLLRKTLIYQYGVKLTTDGGGTHQLTGPWLQLEHLQHTVFKGSRMYNQHKSERSPKMQTLQGPAATRIKDDSGTKIHDMPNKMIEGANSNHENVSDYQVLPRKGRKMESSLTIHTGSVTASSISSVTSLGDSQQISTTVDYTSTDLFTNKEDNFITASLGNNRHEDQHKGHTYHEQDKQDPEHHDILDIDDIIWEVIKQCSQKRLSEIKKNCSVEVTEHSAGELCITGKTVESCRKAKSRLKSLSSNVSDQLKKRIVRTEQLQISNEFIDLKVQDVQAALSGKVFVRFFVDLNDIHIYSREEKSCEEAKVLLHKAFGINDHPDESLNETPGEMSTTGASDMVGSTTPNVPNRQAPGSDSPWFKNNAFNTKATAVVKPYEREDMVQRRSAAENFVQRDTHENDEHSLLMLQGDELESSEDTVPENEEESIGAHLSQMEAESMEDDSNLLYSCTMPKFLRVSVRQGDITKVNAEAIVSAADKCLSNSGGVAKAIAIAGGPSLQRQCSENMYTCGTLDVGQVVATTGGNLRCKHVIHAVGPKWNDYTVKEQCAKDLYRTVHECLKLANTHKSRSIAIPAISSGTLGIPKCTVAKAIYDATAHYDSTFDTSSYLREVIFINIDPDVSKQITDAFVNCGKVDTSLVQDVNLESLSFRTHCSSRQDMTPGGESDHNQEKGWTQKLGKNKKGKGKKKGKGNKQQICSICRTSVINGKSLGKCKHTFCKQCIDTQFKTHGPVCPECGTVYGVLRGNQPEDAKMGVDKHKELHLPGYEQSSTFIITYDVPSGIQTKEHPNPGRKYKGVKWTAYIPASNDGKKVKKLLKKAFDARLIFTVGRSHTTGDDDRVVWSDIPHKTRQDGGPSRYGYPDDSYLQRLRAALAEKGIK